MGVFSFNPLLNNKILEVTWNWKHLQMTNISKMMNSLFDRAENTVEKGENAGISIFSFSHSIFQSLLLWGR